MTTQTILLVLLALAAGWILLRFVLRLTMRIFACGCLALLALAGIGLLITNVL
ncbi:MAG: hypothetical protein GTO14_09700 [Anaerolineales bacterium]|nr:hypothetical protein [Anaerolineales bacterium]